MGIPDLTLRHFDETQPYRSLGSAKPSTTRNTVPPFLAIQSHSPSRVKNEPTKTFRNLTLEEGNSI